MDSMGTIISAMNMYHHECYIVIISIIILAITNFEQYVYLFNLITICHVFMHKINIRDIKTFS